MNTRSSSYDYIVVGAGSAGCALANRLSADRTRRVLVLEAGRDYSSIRVRVPLMASSLWLDPGFNWGYLSEPLTECVGQRLPIPRGKLLGGSSSINGLLYMRGHPRDYDVWQQLGAEGWSYSDVLPYFKRIETHWLGETKYHGANGPISVVRNPAKMPLTAPMIEAARMSGFPTSNDQGGAEPEGFGLPDMTIDAKGRRASSYTAFLRPILRRRNLTIETHAHVTRILIEHARAVGIEYIQNGAVHTAQADCEVILAGGALNSPQLLMVSGIGPADALRALGIKAVVDLPGVGHNLQDHVMAGMNVACTKPFSFDSELRIDRLTLSLLRWGLFGDGQASGTPMPVNGFVRTRPELDRPDIQYMVASLSVTAHPWLPGIVKPQGDSFTTRHVLLHPESRGTVTLSSADPLAKPVVQFNLLSSRRDVETIRGSFSVMRDILSRPPMAALCAGELSPGPDVKTDDEIDAHVRRTASTALHPVGTCAMGSGPEAVVDERLRVRGIGSLRVADASVMPTLTGGNTNAPAIMIGYRASDFILGNSAP